MATPTRTRQARWSRKSRRVAYNPQRRERILKWQGQQNFPICPKPDDPDACNFFDVLTFPGEVHQDILEYQEKRQSSDS
jgi:hypothetical protein